MRAAGIRPTPFPTGERNGAEMSNEKIRYIEMKRMSEEARDGFRKCLSMARDKEVLKDTIPRTSYFFTTEEDMIDGFSDKHFDAVWIMSKSLRDSIRKLRSATRPKVEMKPIIRKIQDTTAIASNEISNALGDTSLRVKCEVVTKNRPRKKSEIAPTWKEKVYDLGISSSLVSGKTAFTIRAERKSAFALQNEGIELFEATVATRSRKNLYYHDGYLLSVKVQSKGEAINVFNTNLSSGLTVIRRMVREAVLSEL